MHNSGQKTPWIRPRSRILRKTKPERSDPMKSFFTLAPKPLTLARTPVALAAIGLLLGAVPAGAVQFEFENGLTANVDTTLSYGVAVRAKGRDPSLIGIANGGTSRSVNEDDGDL